MGKVDSFATTLPRASGASGGHGIVELDRVTKAFSTGAETLLAVAETSLTVAKGEFVSIIGPSGCGKTTVLQMVAGLLPPTSGTIAYNGVSVAGPGPERMVVFQEYGLYPWMTVAGNVGFGLEAKGMCREERHTIVRRTLSLVHLEDFAGRYPHEISGGMKQRVGIARALALSPEIILMDEPFGALDSLTRDTLQAEILRIQQESGQTILLVTHNIDEAVLLSDRVVVMSGRPGAVKRVLNIRLPRPRCSELRVSDAEFAAYRRELTREIHASISPCSAEEVRE